MRFQKSFTNKTVVVMLQIFSLQLFKSKKTGDEQIIISNLKMIESDFSLVRHRQCDQNW